MKTSFKRSASQVYGRAAEIADGAYAKAVVIALVVTATAAANAAGTAVDVSDTVTSIGAQLAPIGLVGMAVLGIVVAVKAFQWVKRALA